MLNQIYTICDKCDHFVDKDEEGFIHLEDGEQEFDHDAVPKESATLQEWQNNRPDLFLEHPDGKIGPNSLYHSRNGKV